LTPRYAPPLTLCTPNDISTFAHDHDLNLYYILLHMTHDLLDQHLTSCPPRPASPADSTRFTRTYACVNSGGRAGTPPFGLVPPGGLTLTSSSSRATYRLGLALGLEIMTYLTIAQPVSDTHLGRPAVGPILPNEVLAQTWANMKSLAVSHTIRYF
jgi:hypothetical protein